MAHSLKDTPTGNKLVDCAVSLIRHMVSCVLWTTKKQNHQQIQASHLHDHLEFHNKSRNLAENRFSLMIITSDPDRKTSIDSSVDERAGPSPQPVVVTVLKNKANRLTRRYARLVALLLFFFSFVYFLGFLHRSNRRFSTRTFNGGPLAPTPGNFPWTPSRLRKIEKAFMYANLIITLFFSLIYPVVPYQTTTVLFKPPVVLQLFLILQGVIKISLRLVYF